MSGGPRLVVATTNPNKLREIRGILTGTGVTKGADVMAGTVRIGEVTRASGGAGLARVRTDRLAQAIAGGEARTCAGSPVSMDPPAWLRAELTSLAQGATADD